MEEMYNPCDNCEHDCNNCVMKKQMDINLERRKIVNDLTEEMNYIEDEIYNLVEAVSQNDGERVLEVIKAIASRRV